VKYVAYHHVTYDLGDPFTQHVVSAQRRRKKSTQCASVFL